MATYIENWNNIDNWFTLTGEVTLSGGCVYPAYGTEPYPPSGINAALQYNSLLPSNVYMDLVVVPSDDLAIYFVEPSTQPVNFANMSSIVRHGIIFEYNYSVYSRNIVYQYGYTGFDNNHYILDGAIGSYEPNTEYRVKISVANGSLNVLVSNNQTNSIISSFSKPITYNDNLTIVVSPGRLYQNYTPEFVPYIGPVSISSNLSQSESQNIVNDDASNAGIPVPISINPGNGTYYSPVNVTITPSQLSHAGMSLRYTTNGDEPNRNSTLYTGQFNVGSPFVPGTSTTITTAYVYDSDASTPPFGSGPFITATYTYQLNPIPSPSAIIPDTGSYNYKPINVSILEANNPPSGTILRYTIDGSNPTSESPIYSGTLKVGSLLPNNSSITVKAAYTRDDEVGPIISETYTILEYSLPKSYDRGATPYGGPINIYSNPYARRSPNGQEIYYDLITSLPEPLKYQPKIMLAAQMMQDYLNDGYRKLPDPNYPYPLNHSHDDRFYRYAEMMGIEYVKDRDIGTWAIQDSALELYKSIYSGETDRLNTDVAWPNKDIYQQYIAFMSNYSSQYSISLPDSVTYYTSSSWDSVCMADYNTTYTEFKNLWYYLSDETSKMVVTFYGSDYVFQKYLSGYNGYVRIGDYYGDYASYPGDRESIASIQMSGYNASNLYNILYGNSDETAANYIFSGIDGGVAPNNVHITVYKNPASDETNLPIITRQLDKIYEWQDPKNFYNYFVSQYQGADGSPDHINNIIDKDSSVPRYSVGDNGIISYTKIETMYSGHNSYRHESYDRSLREKITRLAFCHDIDVVDFDYIQLVAAQMGYDIDISVENIQDNYYAVDSNSRDKMVRNLISNMPYYNALKTTNNALELIFLSMGIVAEVINLYTYGKYEGFTDDFIVEDANSIQNSIGPDRVKYNRAIRNAPLKEWFPSPHFYIKIDASSGYLGQSDASSSLTAMMAKMLKVTKTCKPANTVFKGFYVIQIIKNLNKIYVSGSAVVHKKRNSMSYNYTSRPTDNSGGVLELDPSSDWITSQPMYYDTW